MKEASNQSTLTLCLRGVVEYLRLSSNCYRALLHVESQHKFTFVVLIHDFIASVLVYLNINVSAEHSTEKWN